MVGVEDFFAMLTSPFSFFPERTRVRLSLSLSSPLIFDSDNFDTR